MRDSIDRSQAPSKVTAQKKRLGGYLVEAGLLTPAQVDVALNDQKLTGMRFGEILAARGWVKQQTIEYLMQKVVLPEQQTLDRDPPRQSVAQRPPGNLPEQTVKAVSVRATSTESFRQIPRRDIPISKPLPSVPASDGDVSWVG